MSHNIKIPKIIKRIKEEMQFIGYSISKLNKRNALNLWVVLHANFPLSIHLHGIKMHIHVKVSKQFKYKIWYKIPQEHEQFVG